MRHLRRLALVLPVLVLPLSLAAQVADSTILAAFRWRNIGPVNMGGRVVDIEAVDRDFRRVYLASASGGVFRSDNAGTTWAPIFDHAPSLSIGDIAVFQPNPDIVWVGTGEANNRNSVSWGDGIWKSEDGGQTFANMGLASTHQIARVVTHPTDPQTVWVAAIGHLWGYSGDRGLFKTTDGGRSWSKLTAGLPNDGKHGATDLVIDPSNPEILYVAFYHRLRRPWTFHSGGPEGGIFKTTDGGRTWRKLTRGLPPGETGRIGLAIARSNPRIVMAIVEARQTNDLRQPGSGIYRTEDAGETWRYINTYNNRPFYYSNIRINPVNDQRVYVLTTRFMVSDDGGRTLRNGSEDEEIHGDFHAMWLDPTQADRYYIGMDKGSALTHDHGRAFLLYDNFSISQYYRIGVDMRDPYWVYGGHQDNGTWGGPSFSRDARGILNDDNWKLHWGDGMDVQIDPTDWRRIYSTAENGRFRRYDALTYSDEQSAPHAGNVTNWRELISTDTSRSALRFNWSAPLVMSPHDPRVLYLGGNHIFRTSDGGETWTALSPDLSTRDPEKIVIGRSGGLTLDNSGAEHHGTVTTISESPIAAGVIWAGTDDGNIQLSRDGGRTWSNVRSSVRDVPAGTWVGRIEASHFATGTAYVTFEGHRQDVFTPWIFRTTDFGATWISLTTGIPDGQVVHLVREDLRNPDLLFAGTEFGMYASLDGGRRWHRFSGSMPNVNIQDLVIHPREMDLVAGTHGRGIWIADDLTPLQQLTPAVRARVGHLFEQRPATLWENRSRGGQRGHFWYGGENPRTFQSAGSLPRVRHRNAAIISYWLGAGATGATLEIAESGGTRRRTVTLPAGAGIGRYEWDLRFDGDAGNRAPTAGPGTYRLTLVANGERSSTSLVVRADPLQLTSP
jgi:photosystem II stability/assembly factor-like uncharacterized protein